MFLDEALERELRGIARKRRQPFAAVVREAMAQYIARETPSRRQTLAFEAVGRSGRADTAERHEDLLWTSAHGSPRRTPASGPVSKRRPRR